MTILATYELPWPPTVNTYYRSFNGRAIISNRGRLYRKSVAEMVAISGGGEGLSGRLALEIYAYPPDNRKRDLDNLLKAPLDAMTKAWVYDDDGQIDDLHIIRGEKSKENPGIVVTITSAPEYRKRRD